MKERVKSAAPCSTDYGIVLPIELSAKNLQMIILTDLVKVVNLVSSLEVISK
jgi:hypothetical protein